MPTLTVPEWDAFLSRHPNAHLLQTSQWGQLKAAFGWEPAHIVTNESDDSSQAGAQILFRRLPAGWSLAYIPKGPVGGKWDELWPEVDRLCRERRAIFLKVEPDRWAEPEPSSDQPPLAAYRGETPPNFVPGTHDIQPPRTIVLDIRGEEDQILARMKQKTRYNIRLALRKGVVVRSSNNLDTFDALIQTTGRRGDFGVHSIEYYRKAYELFYPREACELLVAEYEHEPLATVMIFGHGSRAWYFYGASSNQHRNYMPTYLLQWEGIRWARAQGCTEYDLWGVPDADHETLEAKFTNRRDGLWGVYRFKRGFGGQLRRAAGSWDRVYNPLLYKLYCWWTP